MVGAMLIGPTGWAARLSATLGAPPNTLTAAHLEKTIGSAVRESDDLDFKESLYGTSDADKVELAADIASFANDRGGVIVLGIEESDGFATAPRPVALSDGEEIRLKQITAHLLAPYVRFDIHRVPSAHGSDVGFYVLIIPPSPDRPHAVRRDNKLQYPRRNGTTRRWLSESEVADLYRDRFTRIDSTVGRLGAIVDEVLGELAEDAEEPRVIVGAVPAASTAVPNDARRLAALQEWARQFITGYVNGFLIDSGPRVRVGLRRARLMNEFESGPPRWVYAELHTDGSGAATSPLHLSAENATGVHLVHLVWRVARCVNLVLRHAIDNAGAYGDVLLELRLVSKAPVSLIELGNDREPAPAVDSPVVSRHVVSTETLSGGTQAILAITRLLLIDVIQRMGLVELPHLREDGAICLAHFSDRSVEAWADREGVEKTT